jgi:hypothetical protein
MTLHYKIQQTWDERTGGIGPLSGRSMRVVVKLVGFEFIGLIGLAMVGNYIYHLFFNKTPLSPPSPDDPRDEWFQL